MLYWKAVYQKDGELDENEFLSQFKEDGTENKYADIDRWRLGRFDLIRHEDNKAVYSVYLHSDQRLIWRRRTFKDLHSGEIKQVMHVVGWVMTIQTPKGPKNVYAFNYIHEDGSISLDDHRENIELLPEEF